VSSSCNSNATVGRATAGSPVALPAPTDSGKTTSPEHVANLVRIETWQRVVHHRKELRGRVSVTHDESNPFSTQDNQQVVTSEAPRNNDYGDGPHVAPTNRLGTTIPGSAPYLRLVYLDERTFAVLAERTTDEPSANTGRLRNL
jgi:hypothetical protein